MCKQYKYRIFNQTPTYAFLHQKNTALNTNNATNKTIFRKRQQLYWSFIAKARKQNQKRAETEAPALAAPHIKPLKGNS
ncbi:hypothetical protein [Arcticibacter sp. MXS-1]|uniref:hypothetical protein n=1 Tax=Arcticibacter sp. MXS-1 TaxID=3341726 RepID=UPI0035A8A073